MQISLRNTFEAAKQDAEPATETTSDRHDGSQRCNCLCLSSCAAGSGKLYRLIIQAFTLLQVLP